MFCPGEWDFRDNSAKFTSQTDTIVRLTTDRPSAVGSTMYRGVRFYKLQNEPLIRWPGFLADKFRVVNQPEFFTSDKR